jgi:hypothetical protein
MQLIPDVRRVLARAYSLRLMELAALSNIIINVVPYTADYLPWWLTLVLLAGAYVGRLVAQRDAPSTEATNANQ